MKIAFEKIHIFGSYGSSHDLGIGYGDGCGLDEFINGKTHGSGEEINYSCSAGNEDGACDGSGASDGYGGKNGDSHAGPDDDWVIFD